MLPLRGPERLKLQADTFFLPVEGGVWLRNNRGSFTIKSRPAYQWLEKLAPHLTGAATLDQICAGLSPAHRAFVVDLLSALWRNGFLREVTQSLTSPPLPEAWQTHFAQQLEFLAHYTDDPAVRFERYRASRVLCIGAGERLTALVSSLYESGVAHVSALLQARPDARGSLDAVVRHATGRYPDAAFDDLGPEPVAPGGIDALVAGTTAEYVLLDADGHDHARIAAWERACRRHQKLFLPMVAVGRAIMVGPLVTPDSEVTWECAWRRVHDDRLVAAEPPVVSPVSSALAAHVVLYDLFRHVTGVLEPELRARIATIDEDTLVTHVHPVIAHPLSDTRKELAPGAADRDAGLPITAQAGATSPDDPARQPHDAVTDSCFGIIAALDPGELSQLPLSQCVCRVGDPLAMGGHRPLAVRATGLSHAEVRAESVRLALATYAWRLEAAPGRTRRPEPGGVAYPPESLLGLDAASLHGAGEAGWCRAVALPGEQPVWVPASVLPARTPRDASVPAGLAAGLSLAEAVVRGACALVRALVHAGQADQGFLAGQRADDPADLPASSSAYLGLLAAAGKQVRIATAETPWGLPWAGAYIDGVCAGHGCHVTPALAVEMALGHAASALLVGDDDDAPPASPVLAAPADWNDALARLIAQVSGRGLGLVAVELTGDPALTRAGYRIARVLLSKRPLAGGTI